ncbi:MAG TPA: asparagine synthase (glutamine-hydrolyzing), partial [Blastocatellia bacterium]|nr:asparagine synthase (glutamine-hydrolyzing) [Blastocatellia bacterium]
MNFGDGPTVERNDLEAMNRQIVHRGPDDAGYYLAGNIGLAMRRLSIIDLRTGQQPVTNEDRTIWLVFNGEIYNHEELRPRLEALGHHYRSRSDTETIVHLYEEYGRDCVLHLRGMFAFALWDTRTRRFFAARDRLGIKPFYYRHSPQSFLFGSEIKAILAYPGVRAELNRGVLPEYLALGYLAGDETFFSGISKLMPGHTLELDEAGTLKIEPYWDVPAAAAEVHSESYCAKTYRDLLEGAVSSHLMSDVPLGVFLSGGLDSSAVAALMAKARRDAIQTFSVGYDETPYSELPYARAVAEHIGSEHHEIRVTCRNFFDALPMLVWHEDEPIVWTSSVALYFVARLARQRVKVVLTGEGSDETLAGYARYAWTLWNARFDSAYRRLVPSPLRNAVRRFIAHSTRISPGTRRRLAHTFLARNGSSWTSLFFDNFYSAFSEAEQRQLLVDRLIPSTGTAYRNSLAYLDRSS